MSNNKKETALLELKTLRENLLSIVNTSIDGLITRLENADEIETALSFEIIYPLSVNPHLFKGTKPITVLFGKERVAVKNWRSVCMEILQRCIVDPEKHSNLLYLRNKIHGRVRTILSDKPDGMNRPLKLENELYLETYFDTEWLIRILTNEILNTLRFDYSDISIEVRPGKGRRR